VKENRHKVAIHMHAHGLGKVELDGEELKGVTAIQFSTAVGELNRLTVDLLVEEVELVSEETSLTQRIKRYFFKGNPA
jgi:hypothetical protein